MVKNPPANAGDIRDVVRSLGQDDPLKEGMATHSSIFAFTMLWTEVGYSPRNCEESDMTEAT